MSQVKKNHASRKPQGEANKKAIIWTSSIIAVVVVAIVVLLIVSPS